MKPLEGFELEDCLQRIKQFVSKQVNAALGRSGPLWEEESYDRIVRDEEHLWRSFNILGGTPRKQDCHEINGFAGSHPSGKQQAGDFRMHNQMYDGLPSPSLSNPFRRTGKSVVQSILFGLMLCTSATAADEPKTNVILILIDDLGWEDLGCYGSQYYQTPNIDRLAKEGMRFTDGYAACNVCSPTRAAIMTGKEAANVAELHAKLRVWRKGVGADPMQPNPE